MIKYDYLIVGSGLYGSMFAHCATKKGKKCLVIDKRHTAGGNLYCQNIQGINVHTYGPHIFHTSNKEVWDFVNSIVPFNNFINMPVACYEDKLYNLPFNMNTFYQMWGVKTPSEAKEMLDKQSAEALEQMHKEGATEPRNLAQQAQALVGKDIYEKLIKGYTEKQWGRKCEDLPAFIIRRLPIRLTFNNNYFNDTYQGIPIGGYNKLISGLLQCSDVMTDKDFFKEKEHFTSLSHKIVFTGKIDEYFDYCFGELEYRSVRFETQTLDNPNYQGNAVINYTQSDVAYTRIIEHKHFESSAGEVYDNPKTVISKEYSTEWQKGMEPYYPVNDTKNTSLYEKYKALADKETNVVFGGRLAEYKYYDMAPIVERVLNLYKANNL
jgi:UDP-galactopyranose mutase